MQCAFLGCVKVQLIYVWIKCLDNVMYSLHHLQSFKPLMRRYKFNRTAKNDYVCIDRQLRLEKLKQSNTNENIYKTLLYNLIQSKLNNEF